MVEAIFRIETGLLNTVENYVIDFENRVVIKNTSCFQRIVLTAGAEFVK